MVHPEKYLPTSPPPDRPEDKPDDVVGDALYPKEVVDELVARARKEPESVDWAMVAYKLEMTPQELKQYLPPELTAQAKPEGWVSQEDQQKEEDEKRIKKLEEAIAGFKEARREKRKRLLEPASDEHFEKALQGLRQDLGLRRAYQDILVKNNREILENKSQDQLEKLTQDYFGQTTFWERALPWKKKRVEQERQQKEARLDTFRKYISELKGVISSPNNEAALSDQERQISNEAAFTNVSLLDQRQNLLSGSRLFEPSDTKIKKSALKDSGQIVMNDLDHMAKRTVPERTLPSFINNVFDWETGQEILAVYLASVFDNPEEATRFLNDPYNKNATGWSFRLKPAKFDIPGDLRERQSKPGLTNEERDDIGTEILISKTNQGIASNVRAEEISRKMAKIWDKTGLYPPLNLQVRVAKMAVSEIVGEVELAA